MVDSELWQAILLGIVQGITEFLPISSDGHLIIVHALLNRFGAQSTSQTSHLEFDVVLHIGTLAAIIAIYRHDLLSLLKRPRLSALIVLATIPAVVVGFTVKDAVEALGEHVTWGPVSAGLGLLVTAVLLLIGQRVERGEKGLDGLTTRDAIVIGVLQSLAIAPGISRSGSTIAGGLWSGLRRDAAATFSFLMAVPVISGAATLVLVKLFQKGSAETLRWDVLLVGTVTSFVVGLFALSALIRIVTNRKLHWFAYYCLTAGSLTLVWQLVERWM
ncbi:MAG: undecaprenyl-diphosphate phosphatase [Planctomycetales bacterium]|nr:undecaprenyl-diphosphate phosphatase [Planctomycetales bacterium]